MNITALSLSPAFPCDSTVFMGSDGFGIYRTTEGNRDDAIWYPVNNGLLDFGIITLAVSPNFNRCDRASQFNQGDSTVFAGSKSGRVFKSTDGGASWIVANGGLPPMSTPPDYSIAAIGISPNYASDSIVFVAIQANSATGPSGVFRSTDGGSVWLPFDSGLTDRSVQAFGLSANFANDTTLFLGTRFSGVYRFAGVLSSAVPAGVSSINGNVVSGDGGDASSTLAAVTAEFSGLPTASDGQDGAQRSRLSQILYPYPSLHLTATAGGALDGQTAYSVPGPVIFTYQVENNGNETITNLRVIDGGRQDFCGDDPTTTDVDEGLDDTLAGRITSLAPGQTQTLSSTFLVRPSGAEAASPGATFFPRRFAACAAGDSATAGVVNSQDDVIVQLVVWTSITKTNTELSDLWIWSFGVSPFFANDQTVFAGSAYGGLFKSTNAGTASPTWRRVNAGLEPLWLSVRSIVLSPRYPIDKTIYAGTDNGVFRGIENADGTVTWTRVNAGLQRLDVRALAISPNFNQDHVLFAGVWGGDVYRLRNGGENPDWVPQRRFLNGLWVWTTALTADGVLLAGTWSGGPSWPGIIGRNELGGTTGWEFPSLPSLPGGESSSLVVSKTYCQGYEIFLGTWDRGLFKSLDAGKTWQALPLPTSFPVRSVALSPNYASDNTVYVATWGSGIYRSFDRGQTWGQVNAGLSDVLVRTIVMPPTYAQDGVVFAGTDTAGVFRWEPGHNVWAPANNGFPNSRVMSLKASPQYAQDGTLAAATWGGGVAISNDRGQSWRGLSSGLGSVFVRTAEFAPDHLSSGTMYAGTINGPYRSSDRGATWRLLGSPGDDLSQVDITSLSITDVAGQPRTIFASTGGKGIWQLTEAGATSSYSFVAQDNTASRLSGHIIPSLPFHSFVPIAPKNRQGSTC